MTTHTDNTLTIRENGHGAGRDITARSLSDPPAWAREEVAEEIRRFKYECGPLIEQLVAVQLQLRSDPEVRKLIAASEGAIRIGSDGQLNPGALDLATRLLRVPAVAALADSAGSSAIKGIGLITANAEVAFVRGYQAGAEVVMLLPYKIGTYTTPSKAVGRAWTTQTVGLDLGYSATIMPWPLDISIWFRPPEDTEHMVGAYITYVAPPFPPIVVPFVYPGIRVEIFGWVPEKEAASPAGHLDEAFKFIYGFRVILLEFGLHAGIGLAYQGTQVTTNSGIELATYFLSPTNLQAGLEYSASGQGPLQGQVTAPLRGDQPAKTFRTGAEGSTMTLSFPNWMCSAMTTAPTLEIQNDGSGHTSGWLLTSSPSTTDPTYTFQWTGIDGEAWQDTIEFTIAAYSNNIPPLKGKATCSMDGLDNVGTANIDVSFSGCEMSLSAQVFSATGNFTLTVDPAVNSIEDFSGNVASAVLNADDSEAAQSENDFYYLPNPADPAKRLIIDYPADGTSWYAGYQFRQQDETSNAQFRAVFWQVGKPANDNNYYSGMWQSLKDTTTKYTSTAYWSGGNVTSETTLTVTLTPDPS